MIGHNPKASQNQSDEMQDVVALLRSLPQVSAPTDFNARLQARLATAKVEANEFSDITTLIKELPRVAAPADFNFKVRARIAQAKAEQEKAAAGWLAELFGRSFSWAQAGAAMAVVAVIISVVAFGVLRSGPPVKPTDMLIAATDQVPSSTRIPEEQATQTLPPVHNEEEAAAAKIMAVSNLPEPPRIKTTRPVHVPVPLNGSSDQIIPVKESENPPTIATRTVIIKHRSGEARVVNLSEYNLGLQTASLRTSPPNVTPSKEAAFAANIY